MENCCRYVEEFKVSGIWNLHTTMYAASNGHLDCLTYARKNGCPWHIHATLYASKNGHFDCLKYAHENGCPWYIGSTSAAAENGHLDCLKYAHEHGCPWNQRATLYASKNGYLDCLKYAWENGCSLNEELGTLSELEKHVSKIDLDDIWWRSFLFERDLTTYLNLKNVVDTKKEEIKQLQLNSEILFSYTPKDVIKYVLWTYF
jgi:hypothetical protein